MLVAVGQGGVAVGYGLYLPHGEWGAQISTPGIFPAAAVCGGACPNRPPPPRPPFACCTAAYCCAYCSGVSGARAWSFNTWASQPGYEFNKVCYCFGATRWTRSPDQPGYFMGLINVSHPLPGARA